MTRPAPARPSSPPREDVARLEAAGWTVSRSGHWTHERISGCLCWEQAGHGQPAQWHAWKMRWWNDPPDARGERGDWEGYGTLDAACETATIPLRPVSS